MHVLIKENFSLYLFPVKFKASNNRPSFTIKKNNGGPPDGKNWHMAKSFKRLPYEGQDPPGHPVNAKRFMHAAKTIC